MTVKELIEKLSQFDEEAQVFFGYNYGDHGQTQVFQEIRRIDEKNLKYNDYFRLNTEIDEDDVTDETESSVVLE